MFNILFYNNLVTIIIFTILNYGFSVGYFFAVWLGKKVSTVDKTLHTVEKSLH